MTQGTLANHDLGQRIGPTPETLADRPGLPVLATTGGRPLDAIPIRLPDNARVAAFLPYDWLMPKLDLVVTNGGYGTVNHALSLGFPLVVGSVTEDMAEVAARVAWSGSGIDLATNSRASSTATPPETEVQRLLKAAARPTAPANLAT